MADKQQATSSKEGKSSDSSSEALSFDDFQQRIQEAYAVYLKELQDIWQESQKTSYEAYCNTTKALQEELSSIQDQTQYIEVYNKALQGLQENLSQDSTDKRSVAAYRKYLRAVQDSWAHLDIEAVTKPDSKSK